MGIDGDVMGDAHATEQCLLRELATGAAVSGGIGAVTWLIGARRSRPGVAGLGRQTVAWAAVNATIAGVGTWRGRRIASAHGANRADEKGRARSMRRTLLINAGLDVGYIATGIWLTRSAHPRLSDAHGDGVAVIAQGLYLLQLDARYAWRFGLIAQEPD